MGQSSASSDPPRDDAAMSGGWVAPIPLEYQRNGEDPYRLDGVNAGTRTASAYTDGQESYFGHPPAPEQRRDMVAEPQESFLDPKPAEQRDLPADEGVSASDWIAPAAAGVGVAGMAAVAAAELHREKDQGEVVVPPEEEKPEVPEKSTRRSSPPSESAVAVGVANTTTADPKTDEPVVAPAVAAAPISAGEEASRSEDLGGLEREGAHETGTIYPKVMRHDTEMSISQLHIPGKYPKQ